MTDQVKTELGSADILEIMKLLPHRYPFLLVDRIIDIDGDNSAVGIKNVTANEPHFTGHFPDSPIMPGVLLIEGMAQTAGAICTRKEGGGGVTLDIGIHMLEILVSWLGMPEVLDYADDAMGGVELNSAAKLRWCWPSCEACKAVAAAGCCRKAF